MEGDPDKLTFDYTRSLALIALRRDSARAALRRCLALAPLGAGAGAPASTARFAAAAGVRLWVGGGCWGAQPPPRRRAAAIAFLSMESSLSSWKSRCAANSAASSTDHVLRGRPRSRDAIFDFQNLGPNRPRLLYQVKDPLQGAAITALFPTRTQRARIIFRLPENPRGSDLERVSRILLNPPLCPPCTEEQGADRHGRKHAADALEHRGGVGREPASSAGGG